MKILNSILMICLLIPALTSQAQEHQKKKKPKRTDNFIRMEGLRLGTDITRPFQSLWNKGDRYGGEVTADFELYPNFFPVAEAGWEKLKVDQEYVRYNSSGPYFRFGANYNILAATSRTDKDLLYIGFRYGISFASQAVDYYKIDNYWDEETGSFPSQNYNSQWFELVFGMKGEVLKNFYLGWSIRAKFNLFQKEYDLPGIYFNPGFGNAENSSNADITYSISYNIPFRIKRHKNAVVPQPEGKRK